MFKAPNSDSHDRRQPLPARLKYRPMLPYLGMGLLLVLAIVVVGRQIAHHIDAIESWITNLGHWSALAFIGLYILTTSLLLPETVMAILAGALFGLRWGFAVVAIGSLLAAALQFILARHILRTHIQRFADTRPTLAVIQRAVQRDAFRLQVLLRLTPLNPATISYLLGALGVRFPAFLMACSVLSLHWFVEVYFGRAGKHIARMAGRQTPEVYLHDLAVIGGLVVTLIVMVLVSRAARKAVMEAVSKAATEPTAAKK
ncbi:MAG: TVP38/TMEM64 family protein [Desulfobacterales bacterium]|nr:TVP38/TMEM64 family protein [Desulfobacterales bacterium]